MHPTVKSRKSRRPRIFAEYEDDVVEDKFSVVFATDRLIIRHDHPFPTQQRRTTAPHFFCDLRINRKEL